MANGATATQEHTLTAAELKLERLIHFDGARDPSTPTDRLRELRRRALGFREELLAGPQVTYYRSLDLVRVPYPTRYAFWRASRVPTPLLHIVNRLFVVQFRAGDALKTLLISPSDIAANKATPFFAELASKARLLGRFGERLLAPIYGTVEERLAEVGLQPADVDYISYGHLHTQDIRSWFGANGASGYFPNAKLLVTRQEWASVAGLLPPHAQWYVPGGCESLDPARVVLLDHDVRLGEGIALVRTPGHTEGNHSFVVHTPEGLLVTSENGVSADNYAPLRSRIPGVAEHARRTGAEVVLNGNTLEGANEQYLSMVQEKEIAGPSQRDPNFYNVLPSSELRAYWAFPGVKPTFSFPELEYGRLQRPPRADAARASGGGASA